MNTFTTHHNVRAVFVPRLLPSVPMNTPCEIVHGRDLTKFTKYRGLAENPSYHSTVFMDVYMNSKDPVCAFFNNIETMLEFEFELSWEMTDKGAVWIREETNSSDIMMIFDGPGGAQIEHEMDMSDYGGWAHSTWDRNNNRTYHPIQDKDALIAFLLRIAERVAHDWKAETGPTREDLQALAEELKR